MDVFCKSRGELTKHFLALKNYRNSIKHNRDMNVVEGKMERPRCCGSNAILVKNQD